MSRDIDEIIRRVRSRVPDVDVSQLRVKYPGADDDGLWFFKLPGDRNDVQVESSSGQCPFVVEHCGMAGTAEALTARSVDAAADAVVAYLDERRSGR